MNQVPSLFVNGIPNQVPETAAALCRSRLLNAVTKLLEETDIENVQILVGTKSEIQRNSQKISAESSDYTDKKSDYNLSPEERAKKYKASKPLFTFEQLVVTKEVEEDLLLAVDLIQLESKVFDEWGLRQIEPFPRTALNFHGKPGTGKTLAAHAIASKINRPILVASYAQIESMYHGEGPKNVEAIFMAAERENALLFIDEADSLLSKRLTNVNQGSEQAINSMRSQLLICLERFRGVVIFSTNLVQNYDKAFETRVRHVNFPMPDEICRQKIWGKHLPDKMPKAKDVLVEELAKVDDVCGRDIKNAVIDAAMRVARQGKKQIELDDFFKSIEGIKKSRINVDSEFKSLTPEENKQISEKVKAAIAREGNCDEE
ncbi:ATPase, AAA family protein [Coleofasciculus chthonoplastes PCC 7420]|uniref:ATPase, AAA family protein n=1 Tax=Coleofasciculus chthonoplastes PCC 7420 TaxID=118168 RepID=B4W038_9CYAN|nr:ATP-binding protein [Coleofasciculus chthonoplastes]EDX72482.1 ATPase, AAA family protein [Coleofasciculus chthonoplastes PCC 7420]